MPTPRPPTGDNLKNDIQTLVLKELNKSREHFVRLADLSGFSYRYIHAVASGQIKDPAFNKLVHLASFLGIRVTHEPCNHFNKRED